MPGVMKLKNFPRGRVLSPSLRPARWRTPQRPHAEVERVRRCFHAPPARPTGSSNPRVELPARIVGNSRVCEVVIDQSRTIDRRRLVRRRGSLPLPLIMEVYEKLRRVGDFLRAAPAGVRRCRWWGIQSARSVLIKISPLRAESRTRRATAEVFGHGTAPAATSGNLWLRKSRAF